MAQIINQNNEVIFEGEVFDLEIIGKCSCQGKGCAECNINKYYEQNEQLDKECTYITNKRRMGKKTKEIIFKDMHKKQSIRLFNDGWSNKGIAEFLEIEVYEVERYLK
jgi:DNA-binding NarL/FixJ family response regulator